MALFSPFSFAGEAVEHLVHIRRVESSFQVGRSIQRRIAPSTMIETRLQYSASSM